jgi:hypothetical protein
MLLEWPRSLTMWLAIAWSLQQTGNSQEDKGYKDPAELVKAGDWHDITQTFWAKNLITNAFLTPNSTQESFRVLVNTHTQQAVIAFQGSDNFQNWVSDFTPTDQGATVYNSIEPLAAAVLDNMRSTNSGCADYSFFSAGNSLGGGVAQGFAVAKQIAGFAENPLPIAPGLMADPSFAALVRGYQNIAGGSGPDGWESLLVSFVVDERIERNHLDEKERQISCSSNDLLIASGGDIFRPRVR